MTDLERLEELFASPSPVGSVSRMNGGRGDGGTDRFLSLEDAVDDAEAEARLGGGIGDGEEVVVGRGKAMALQPAQQCK